jgi:hypothetical protein
MINAQLVNDGMLWTWLWSYPEDSDAARAAHNELVTAGCAWVCSLAQREQVGRLVLEEQSPAVAAQRLTESHPNALRALTSCFEFVVVSGEALGMRRHECFSSRFTFVLFTSWAGPGATALLRVIDAVAAMQGSGLCAMQLSGLCRPLRTALRANGCDDRWGIGV